MGSAIPRVAVLATGLAILLVAGTVPLGMVTAHGPDDVAADASTPTWPALEDASIRPGARVVTDGATCTSNFVFQDTTTGDLYLGLAAHCVGGEGQTSQIHGVDGDTVTEGTVAYSSFDHDTGHDFALVEIPDDAEGSVHPAVLHFGGPTELADSGEVSPGEKFLFYGNTSVRQGVEPTNWHEGIITQPRSTTTRGHAITPGIPGDSGSGVLDGEGRALGVLVTLGVHSSVSVDPLATTATNAFTNLDVALTAAEQTTGMQLELMTWELIEPGLLPAPAG